MISVKQFEERCDRLVRDMRKRLAAKYWKSGKRAGQVRIPGRELPFDRYDMRTWMSKHIGLSAKACPYCRRPIDILSLELDHVTPLARGGDLTLDNLEATCPDCNCEKGALTGPEYRKLRDFWNTLEPAARTHIRRQMKTTPHHFIPPKKGARPGAPQPQPDEAF